MSQWKYTKKRKKGEHLTYIDRQKLEMLVRKNESLPAYKKHSIREIACLLESSPATISRELKKRGRGPVWRRAWLHTIHTLRCCPKRL